MVASANHNRKEYVRVQTLPAPPRSSAARLVRSWGHPEKRTVKVKGGDQHTEGTFSAVKRALRKRNALNNTRRAGAHAAAAAFNRETPGLRALGAGVAVFLNSVMDKQDPDK